MTPVCALTTPFPIPPGTPMPNTIFCRTSLFSQVESVTIKLTVRGSACVFCWDQVSLIVVIVNCSQLLAQIALVF